MSFSDDVNNALQPIDDWICDYPDTYIWYITFVFIIAAGLLFIYKFKFMQVMRLPEQCKLIGPENDVDKAGTSKISSFQAFCVGLGARIGVGNIAGVASAIAAGGPGAIFWMWIFAIIGAGTSFVECTLGQIFKEKKSDGQFHGGPAYYIKNGLKNHKFAVFIAFWIIVTYGIGFIANQAANASDAFVGVMTADAVGEFVHDNAAIIISVIFVILTAFLVFGGIVRIAKFSEIIVPLMALGWMIFAAVCIAMNLSNIGNAFSLIFNSAFDFQSIFGGFAGSCIMWGLKRGVFSNEAGIGSVPNVSSSAHVEHPVRQGYIQSVGVLIDTLVVCSASAFLILTFGDYSVLVDAGFTKSGLVQEILAQTIGEWAKYILAVFLFVFAFSSLIAYYSMSEANLRFIKDGDAKLLFALRVMIVLVVFCACIIPVGLVWDICDVFMAIMGILNITALFMLYKYVVAVYKDYRKQKDQGIEMPLFDIAKMENEENLDLSGITCWSKQ